MASQGLWSFIGNSWRFKLLLQIKNLFYFVTFIRNFAKTMKRDDLVFIFQGVSLYLLLLLLVLVFSQILFGKLVNILRPDVWVADYQNSCI